MPSDPNEAFLKLVWTRSLYTQLEPSGTIVLDHGATTEDGIGMTGARIERDGTIYNGPVAIHARSSDWRRHLHHLDSSYDRCILQVVEHDDAVVCRTDGSVVPTVEMHYPPELAERYRALIDGCESYRCGETLADMPAVKRYGLITELTIERLERKYNDFLNLYREAGNNWNEAFYIMLFRTMGAGSNREPYMRLARTVRYTDLCKIRESVTSAEALLLGGAGLLQGIEYPDRYTYLLQQEFRHLSRRFEIVPMHRQLWMQHGHNPRHAPLLRIVELAALLCSQEFMFSRLLGCKSTEEIRRIFSVQASEYWTTHYLPGRHSRYSVKSFGDMMLDNLTINLVAPMMFTYGKATSDDALQETAVDMLEKTRAENNIYIRGWKSKNVAAENAFFSQGLLQLSREYCEKKRCAECNIGRNMLCYQ